MISQSISTATKLEVYSTIEACNKIKTELDFEIVFKTIHNLIGQEMGAYGIGNVQTMEVVSICNAGFPEGFISTIIDTSGLMQSPLIRLWMRYQTPQIMNFNDGVINAPSANYNYNNDAPYRSPSCGSCYSGNGNYGFGRVY